MRGNKLIKGCITEECFTFCKFLRSCDFVDNIEFIGYIAGNKLLKGCNAKEGLMFGKSLRSCNFVDNIEFWVFLTYHSITEFKLISFNMKHFFPNEKYV